MELLAPPARPGARADRPGEGPRFQQCSGSAQRPAKLTVGLRRRCGRAWRPGRPGRGSCAWWWTCLDPFRPRKPTTAPVARRSRAGRQRPLSRSAWSARGPRSPACLPMALARAARRPAIQGRAAPTGTAAPLMTAVSPAQRSIRGISGGFQLSQQLQPGAGRRGARQDLRHDPGRFGRLRRHSPLTGRFGLVLRPLDVDQPAAGLIWTPMPATCRPARGNSSATSSARSTQALTCSAEGSSGRSCRGPARKLAGLGSSPRKPPPGSHR